MDRLNYSRGFEAGFLQGRWAGAYEMIRLIKLDKVEKEKVLEYLKDK